jgi:hypothetical protein
MCPQYNKNMIIKKEMLNNLGHKENSNKNSLQLGLLSSRTKTITNTAKILGNRTFILCC